MSVLDRENNVISFVKDNKLLFNGEEGILCICNYCYDDEYFVLKIETDLKTFIIEPNKIGFIAITKESKLTLSFQPLIECIVNSCVYYYPIQQLPNQSSLTATYTSIISNQTTIKDIKERTMTNELHDYDIDIYEGGNKL